MRFAHMPRHHYYWPTFHFERDSLRYRHGEKAGQLSAKVVAFDISAASGFLSRYEHTRTATRASALREGRSI